MLNVLFTLMVLSADPLRRLSPGSKCEKHVTAFLCSLISHTRVADCPLMSHTYLIHKHVASFSLFFSQLDISLSFQIGGFFWLMPHVHVTYQVNPSSSVSFLTIFKAKNVMLKLLEDQKQDS